MRLWELVGPDWDGGTRRLQNKTVGVRSSKVRWRDLADSRLGRSELDGLRLEWRNPVDSKLDGVSLAAPGCGALRSTIWSDEAQKSGSLRGFGV